MSTSGANSDSPARRHTVLPREGKYWLGAFACLWVTGWVKGINLILLLSYLMLAMWALNWMIARRSLRGLRAQRLSIEPVFAGSSTSWQVEVEAPRRRSFTGWELSDTSAVHAAQWFVPMLLRGEALRLRRLVQFPRRGTFACQPLRVSSSFPFGLVRQDVMFDRADSVTVYPAIGQIDLHRLRRWLATSARPDERSRRHRQRLTQEMEFHGLRSFQPGDSPRWIHWRTSARKGELMVREFDQGTHHDLLLIVEVVDNPRADDAVSLAATIAWNWAMDSGDRIVLAVASEGTAVIDSRGAGQAGPGMLTQLAGVQPAARTDLTRLAVEIEERGLPAGPVLLITNRDDDWSAEFLERRLERPVARLHPADEPRYYEPPHVVAVK